MTKYALLVSFCLLFFCNGWAATSCKKTFDVQQEIKTFVERSDVQERLHIKDGYVRFALDTIEKCLVIADQPSGWDRAVNTIFYTLYSCLPLLGGLRSSDPDGIVLIAEHDAPTLHACVQELCQSVRLPKPLLFFDGDKNRYDAAADSWGTRHAFIVLTRKLLETSSDQGIQGVLAHELAHIKHNHSPILLATMLIVFIGGLLLFHYDWRALVKNSVKMVGIISLMIAVLCVVTRVCEAQADDTAYHQFWAAEDFSIAMDELKQHACTDFENYHHEMALLQKKLKALKVKSPKMAAFLSWVTKFYDLVTSWGYEASIDGYGLDHPSLKQRAGLIV